MSREPTVAQLAAEALVRRYIGRAGLSVEDDEAFADGVIKIHTADREGADEEPSEALRATFRDHVTRLRALSPLIYVGSEEVDEWICLTITIRAEPRKPKPDEIPRLVDKVLSGLPAAISSHPRVRRVVVGHWNDGRRGLQALTDIDGYIGKLTADLTWRLVGNSVNGWELVIYWGWHRVCRPAAFKKLTPAIILRELRRITDGLTDPLDCLGYTIHVKQHGSYVCSGDRRSRVLHAPWQVLTEDRLRVHLGLRGQSVEFTNRLTGEFVELQDGDETPAHLVEYCKSY